MNITSLFTLFRRHVLPLLALATALNAAAPSNPYVGRWALTIPGGRAGWLEVKEEGGRTSGSLLWGGGSVLPVASVTVANNTLTVTRVREIERKDASGKAQKQKITDTITGRLEGNDTLKLSINTPRANGKGSDNAEFTGKRIPPLPPRPNLAKVKFGSPVQLLDGRSLAGWRVMETNVPNAWVVEQGVLHNRPPAEVPGQPKVRTANLRTEREFEDFNLKIDVNVPAKSNSGVYLRGLYEIQVLDSKGKPLDSHNMGAVYSRIAPSASAEKAAGEWQTLDLTLVDRHVTVVLNGTKIIDNQPLLGCTGGALFSDESRPGPIMLQGDHGAVSFRNIVLRPVVR